MGSCIDNNSIIDSGSPGAREDVKGLTISIYCENLGKRTSLDNALYRAYLIDGLSFLRYKFIHLTRIGPQNVVT